MTWASAGDLEGRDYEAAAELLERIKADRTEVHPPRRRRKAD